MKDWQDPEEMRKTGAFLVVSMILLWSFYEAYVLGKTFDEEGKNLIGDIILIMLYYAVSKKL